MLVTRASSIKAKNHQEKKLSNVTGDLFKVL
jgi:hypothetical protein